MREGYCTKSRSVCVCVSVCLSVCLSVRVTVCNNAPNKIYQQFQRAFPVNMHPHRRSNIKIPQTHKFWRIYPSDTHYYTSNPARRIKYPNKTLVTLILFSAEKNLKTIKHTLIWCRNVRLFPEIAQCSQA